MTGDGAPPGAPPGAPTAGASPCRVLILGGTREARRLGDRLAGHPAFMPLLSLAGRTRNPIAGRAPLRRGGFGGAAGLEASLRAGRYAAMIDATHPFAQHMSAQAVRAARAAGVPLLRLERPPWPVHPDWQRVADEDDAAAALAPCPPGLAVFLALGRQRLQAFAALSHLRLVVRLVDPDPPEALPQAEIVTGRGPSSLETETALLRRYGIDRLVLRNSGGDATVLEAAHRAGTKILMIERPDREAKNLDDMPVVGPPSVETVDAALSWLLGPEVGPVG